MQAHWLLKSIILKPGIGIGIPITEYKENHIAPSCTATFVWTGVKEDFSSWIELISNREHQVVDFRTGYGFDGVTIQVYDTQDNLAFEERDSLDGTLDPDIRVEPNVVGQWIRFISTGSEARDYGGFVDLKVGVAR